MATKEEIKKAILAVAGDPISGAIADLADSMADAVLAIDKPALVGESKEARVIKPTETR